MPPIDGDVVNFFRWNFTYTPSIHKTNKFSPKNQFLDNLHFFIIPPTKGRHSLKGCLYVHVCACWYVCAIRIGTCMCYAYWYTCVLCLLVRMCATMLIGTHDCYANLYTCVLRMCAMLIGTHVCYAFWHTCMLCLLARMCGLIIGTHMCCAYWYADYYWQSTRHSDCCANW